MIDGSHVTGRIAGDWPHQKRGEGSYMDDTVPGAGARGERERRGDEGRKRDEGEMSEEACRREAGMSGHDGRRRTGSFLAACERAWGRGISTS